MKKREKKLGCQQNKLSRVHSPVCNPASCLKFACVRKNLCQTHFALRSKTSSECWHICYIWNFELHLGKGDRWGSYFLKCSCANSMKVRFHCMINTVRYFRGFYFLVFFAKLKYINFSCSIYFISEVKYIIEYDSVSPFLQQYIFQFAVQKSEFLRQNLKYGN